jgi:hypothetical protein
MVVEPRPLDREHLAAATRPTDVAVGAEMDRLHAVLVPPLALSTRHRVRRPGSRSGRRHEGDDPSC